MAKAELFDQGKDKIGRLEVDIVKSSKSPKQAQELIGEAKPTKARTPLSINPEEGEDDLTLLKSYNKGDSSKRTPEDDSSNVDLPTTLIKGFDRLDRIHVMHDESFFPEMLNMSIMQEIVTSDHFPICFEFNKHGLDMYKTLLHRVPLRFNSSLLLHSLFDAYMQQIFGMFSEQVILKGWHAWDITLQNVNDIHRIYGMTNAKRRKKLIDKFSYILTRCNVLSMNNPHIEELLDLHIQVQDIVKILSCQSY